MKKMFRFVLPVVVPAMLMACSPKQEKIVLPDTTTLIWVDGFNRGDTNRLVSAFTKDGAVLAPNSTMARGPEEIAKIFSSTIDQNYRLSVKNEESELRDDVGYRMGSYLLQDAEGSKLDYGKCIEIWRKVEGQWKISRLTWASDLPARGGPQPLAGSTFTKPVLESH